MYLCKGKEDGEEPKRKDNDLNELQLKYLTLKREGGEMVRENSLVLHLTGGRDVHQAIRNVGLKR